MAMSGDSWKEKDLKADENVDIAGNSSGNNLTDKEVNKDENLASNEASTEEREEEDDDDDNNNDSPTRKRRSRTTRTYPASSFTDSLEIGAAIYEHAGKRIRRLTLLEKMERSPTSGTTRQMITNSNKYGITSGSYNAEYLELTDDGYIIFDDSNPPRRVLRAKFELAISQILPFKKLYDEYVGKRLAALEVMRDFLRESGEQIDDFKECIDFFVVNAKDLELLRTIGGAETLIPIEQALDELPTKYEERNSQPVVIQKIDPELSETQPNLKNVVSPWDKTCFYITPIGEEDSEQRKHTDLFLI